MTHETASDREMSRSWLAIAIASGALVIAIIFYGYLYSFARLGMSGGHIALCVFVLLIFALGALAKEEVIPWRSNKRSDWLNWKTMGAAVYTLMLAALSATAIIQLLDPKDTAPELIKAGVDAAHAAQASDRLVHGLETSGLLSPIGEALAAGLPGVWGERGCSVTYRMTLEHNSLTMRSLDAVSGLPPFHQVLRLAPPRTTSDGGLSVMAEVVDGPDIGSSIMLDYQKIASVERLVRVQQAPQRLTTFDRCGQ